MVDHEIIESAVEKHQSLVKAIESAKYNFLLVGKLLYELQQGELFRSAIGDGCDNWDSYISQPEIGLSRGEAGRLSQIYEYFVVRYGYDTDRVGRIPVKNLHYLLPIAKKGSKEEIEALIDDAEHLPQNDFKEICYSKKNETEERTYEFLIMKRCVETGTMSRIKGISSEAIKETFNLF